ncbi:MAG: lipid-binding SYLF domain-containing protein [Synoicihabitans sp.]
MHSAGNNFSDMKRFIPLALAFLVTTLAVQAERSLPRKNYVTRVESCEAIIREFQYDPEYRIPKEVLQRAETIVIINQFKAGFLFGIKDGYGVVMSRRDDGTWSVPGFVNAGEASFGLQVGANAIETVLVITDKSVQPLLYKNKFNIGVDAKAIAGPRVHETERITALLKQAPVLVYTKKKGLYAGATVKGGWLSANNRGNRAFYQTRYSLPEILMGDWVQPQPEVEHIRDFVTAIARR